MIQQLSRANSTAYHFGAVIVCALLLSSPVSAQTLQNAVASQIENDQAMAASQERINAVVDRTQDSASEYSRTMAELESLNKYNAQLQKQVTSQEQELESIRVQLDDIEITNREVAPLMDNMLIILDQFVRADIPFLLEERSNRVNNLRDVLTRADVTIAEKYRRLLEAYQIELEYGRTFDTYEGMLPASDNQKGRTVQFVRLGRVSLMYQTLDAMETGYWDADQRAWKIDNSYADEIGHAISVAKQEIAPDLVKVPVHAPVEVQL